VLARFLAALPSVKLARDLAVADEKLAAANDRIARLNAQLHGVKLEQLDLQRKYDRLVEARLFRQGDVNAPFTEAPKPSVPAAQGPFGGFGRVVGSPYPAPTSDSIVPVGADVAG
jgi:hypothetical protein